ncbi:hypothetical protein GAYE_SCF45G5702 [Galdieria yellowstonensis]|uniref:Reverse transcriptase zinc-binding domain-containing protein n=1 Tax=Galdieria yellowstonensis TaxID=3028027 RepID=A0AAV9IKJ0_9RHOD|nr:hypothetical protein GAYE_SCF45G5702 [Galdieria yellowstonensis]
MVLVLSVCIAESKSLQWLTRICVGAWCSCSSLARIGILDEEWKTRCPYCLANVPERLSHLLYECTRWASKRLVIFGLLGVRLVVTNSLEENSSTTVEVQEKKALDEASNRWWTTGEFTYQACINSMLVALELDNGLSQCGFRTDLPGFILVGQFLVAVMGIRMFIPQPRRLSFDSSDVTTTSRRPKGYGKPLE